jgi:hypothetical protein
MEDQMGRPPNPEMICRVCNQTLPLNDFPANRGQAVNGLFRCKSCSKREETLAKDKHYAANKEIIKKRSTAFHKARQTEWNTYFQNQYGDPYCQICDKKLEWHSGNKSLSVHFDHKHGLGISELAKPSTWLRVRYCTPENISVFENCDFGILCNHCNRVIPTLNRKQWVDKLVKYAAT